MRHHSKEDELTELRSVVLDFNLNNTNNNNQIEKVISSIKKISNLDKELGFILYRYKTKENKIIARIIGANLNSELFLKGLEDIKIKDTSEKYNINLYSHKGIIAVVVLEFKDELKRYMPTDRAFRDEISLDAIKHPLNIADKETLIHPCYEIFKIWTEDDKEYTIYASEEKYVGIYIEETTKK